MASDRGAVTVAMKRQREPDRDESRKCQKLKAEELPDQFIAEQIRESIIQVCTKRGPDKSC